MGGSPWAEGWEGSYEGRESLLYGMGRSALLVAGAEATFRRCELLLRSLAGGLSYVGDQVGIGYDGSQAALRTYSERRAG